MLVAIARTLLFAVGGRVVGLAQRLLRLHVVQHSECGVSLIVDSTSLWLWLVEYYKQGVSLDR